MTLDTLQTIGVAYSIAGCGFALHTWHLLRAYGVAKTLRKLPFRLGEITTAMLCIGVGLTWPGLYVIAFAKYLKRTTM